jgi:hypothetical protein
VPTAYDAEQRIFEVLQALRVAAKREFFVGPSDRFVNALDRFAASDPKDLKSLLVDTEPSSREAPDMTMPSLHERDLAAFSGQACVYAVSNPCHRPNTFRLGWTAQSALARVSQMNRPQRRYTSQIGFYRLVHVVPVASPEAAAREVLLALKSFRVAPRRPFLRVDIDELKRAMDSVATAGLRGTALPPNPGSKNTALGPSRIAVTAVSHVHATWAPWSSPCTNCGQQLRFTSQIGVEQLVSCPRCSGAMWCSVGSRGVLVRGQHSQ